MTHPLVVIPTPIGNLEDITLRALRLLKEVDLVYAEDTRTTGRLFEAHGITTPLKSFHLHNEHKVAAEIAQKVAEGSYIGLVSDAGTPAISDPGFLAVRACVEAGLQVTCLPGATAFVPALVASGLPAERFFFEGFLPNKKGRKSRLEVIESREVSSILYESPKRLAKLLGEVVECMGEDRTVVVAREVSKRYEEYRRGTAKDLLNHFTENEALGEIVVVIAPKEKEEHTHQNKYKKENS